MKIIQDERKLTLAGKGTYYVTIPISMIKQLKWKKGEKKIIRQDGERIIIEDWKPQLNSKVKIQNAKVLQFKIQKF